MRAHPGRATVRPAGGAEDTRAALPAPRAPSAAVRLEQPRSSSWRHFEAERRRNGLDWLRKGGGGEEAIGCGGGGGGGGGGGEGGGSRRAAEREECRSRAAGVGRARVEPPPAEPRVSRCPRGAAVGAGAGAGGGEASGGCLSRPGVTFAGATAVPLPSPSPASSREAPRAASPFRLPEGRARGAARSPRCSGVGGEQRAGRATRRASEGAAPRRRGGRAVRARPPLHRYSTDT
ncbi:hypothetical protein LEMLEM_LOCUS20972 [Lemmus lemmus]